jgi:hypothetical protein
LPIRLASENAVALALDLFSDVLVELADRAWRRTLGGEKVGLDR